MNSDYTDNKTRSELRIGTEEAFDRYFLYGNYEGDIPNSLIMKVVSNITQPEKYRKTLEPFYYSPKLRRILDYVRFNSDYIQAERGSLSDIVTLIFDMSDFLKEDIATSFTSPIRFYATNAILDLLRDTDPERRANIIFNAIYQTQSVAGFLMTVTILKEEQEKRPQKKEFIPKDRLVELLVEADERGLRWLGSDSCLDHPEFRTVIWLVKKLAHEKHFESTLLVLIQKELENYKKFLKNYLVDRGPIEYGKVAGKEKIEFDFKGIDSIIDLQELRRIRLNMNIHFLENEPESYKMAWDMFNDGINKYLHTSRSKKKNDEEEK